MGKLDLKTRLTTPSVLTESDLIPFPNHPFGIVKDKISGIPNALPKAEAERTLVHNRTVMDITIKPFTYNNSLPKTVFDVPKPSSPLSISNPIEANNKY